MPGSTVCESTIASRSRTESDLYSLLGYFVEVYPIYVRLLVIQHFITYTMKFHEVVQRHFAFLPVLLSHHVAAMTTVTPAVQVGAVIPTATGQVGVNPVSVLPPASVL